MASHHGWLRPSSVWMPNKTLNLPTKLGINLKNSVGSTLILLLCPYACSQTPYSVLYWSVTRLYDSCTSVHHLLYLTKWLYEEVLVHSGTITRHTSIYLLTSSSLYLQYLPTTLCRNATTPVYRYISQCKISQPEPNRFTDRSTYTY